MKFITVKKISMDQYFRLQALGIKVNFVNPTKDVNERYLIGKKTSIRPAPMGNGGIEPNIEVSTQVPYVLIKDKR